MKEIIIIKINKPEKIKLFLDQEKQNYRVFNQAKRKKDLYGVYKNSAEPFDKDPFANYQEVIKDKEREAEISLLDQAQEEEDEENEDLE